MNRNIPENHELFEYLDTRDIKIRGYESDKHQFIILFNETGSSVVGCGRSFEEAFSTALYELTYAVRRGEFLKVEG